MVLIVNFLERSLLSGLSSDQSRQKQDFYYLGSRLSSEIRLTPVASPKFFILVKVPYCSKNRKKSCISIHSLFLSFHDGRPQPHHAGEYIDGIVVRVLH